MQNSPLPATHAESGSHPAASRPFARSPGNLGAISSLDCPHPQAPVSTWWDSPTRGWTPSHNQSLPGLGLGDSEPVGRCLSPAQRCPPSLEAIILQPVALAPWIYCPDPLGSLGLGAPGCTTKERVSGEGQGGEGGVRLGPTPGQAGRAPVTPTPAQPGAPTPQHGQWEEEKGTGRAWAGWGLKLGRLAEESSWEPPLRGVQGEGRQPKLFLHKNVGGESPD